MTVNPGVADIVGVAVVETDVVGVTTGVLLIVGVGVGVDWLV